MNYYKTSDAENAMAVVASWISKNPKIKVEYHNGKAVDADIFTGRIRIPRLACASGLNQEALMLLRGQIYHEGKHIDSTKLEKKEYPKGALFSILNGLEDRRIEAEGSEEHLGCKMVFRWMSEYYNQKIAGQIVGGEIKDAFLWEAVCAMGFVVDGITPAWKLSSKAQAYFDAAYDEFAKVRQAKDTKDCLELAKKIYDILKQTSEDFNEQQEKKEEKKEDKKEEKSQDKGKGKQEKSEDGDDGDDGEGSGAAGDMEDDSEKDEKGSDDSDEESDEESDDSDKGSGKGSNEESDEESDDKSEGSGKGSDDKSDLEDEAGNSEGSEESGKGSEESDDSDSDENGSSSDSNKGKDVAYKPDNSGKAELVKSGIEEEVAGPTAAEIMNERLEEIFDNLPEVDKQYLACRDKDEHITPPTELSDKSTFADRRGKIGAAVANMTHALAQSLRSLAKCRKNPYLRQGKIDKKRLVQITKSLSREVFYKTQKGQELDVAVEVIVDESGSMCNFYEVQLMLIAMGESLAQIGVPFEVTGTTTKGAYGSYDKELTRYNPIIYKHYKTFGEQWVNVRQRICYTGAFSNNVDGEAVEYAAFRLAQRKESRKVIFSLSDGQPCAGQGNDGEMCSNLKRVCQRVRKAGIEVYGFGIGTQAPAAFYGKNYFMFLADVSSMGQEFIKKFVDVITAGKVRV